MPKFAITTQVSATLPEVWKNFDEKLFRQLAPPFPFIKLLRFDGCLQGNEVHLELNFIFFKQRWISKITQSYIREDEVCFVDEGKALPFFLTRWRHVHLLQTTPEGTFIKDIITFETPSPLLNWLILPALYFQFLYRKPIYKRYFKARNSKT
ncbi:MAG: hypothetical protein RMJ44_01450 [Cytophagales bacterium]|nr:hypothetical protein [Bernardetiaceae bacterium]MDW8209726.1 hypothetical protein [Cytophagales bacterium]